MSRQLSLSMQQHTITTSLTHTHIQYSYKMKQFFSKLKLKDNNLTTTTHCVNSRQNRCKDLNSCHFGELEETTRTPSYYMDEDYPARPEIQQPLRERSNRHGSESSTLETDVCLALHTPSGAYHKRRRRINDDYYLQMPVYRVEIYHK